MVKENKNYCTVPRWFGFDNWFEKRFWDLCIEHDEKYIKKEGSRLSADYQMARGIYLRGYKSFAILCYLLLLGFGWLYWYDFLETSR